MRYHFPRTLSQSVEKSIGDHIVYYEPRRSSIDLVERRRSPIILRRCASHGSYRRSELTDHYFALVEDYLDFDRSVPFVEGSEYYESALKKADGSTNKGAFRAGRATHSRRRVRSNSEIWFCASPWRRMGSCRWSDARAWSEPPAPFERPIVEMTVFATVSRAIVYASTSAKPIESMRDDGIALDQWRRSSRSTGSSHSARGV